MAAIGIGKQTLGTLASLPRQRGRNKGLIARQEAEPGPNGGVAHSLDEAKAFPGGGGAAPCDGSKAGDCQSWRRMTRRSLLALCLGLLVALGGRLKPRAKADVNPAPMLDRGELRMAKGRGFHGRV